MEAIGLDAMRQRQMIELGAVDLTGLTSSTTIDGTIPEQWAREFEDFVTPKRFLARFAIEKSDLQRNPGDLIHIQKRTKLSATGDLTETTALQGTEEKLAYTEVTFAPKERGNAVLPSTQANSKSIADLRAEARTLLGDWAAQKIDADGYAALGAVAASKLVLPAGVATIGAITSTDKMTAFQISKARAILETNDVPKFNVQDKNSPHALAQGVYIAILNPSQLFDLSQDTDYKDAANQAAMIQASRVMGARFQGFDGMWDGVLIYSTSNIPFTDDSGTYTTKIAKGVIFGERAFARAVGLQGENAPDYIWNEQVFDYGRFFGIAVRWYDEWKILNDDRLYGLYSAATDTTVP